MRRIGLRIDVDTLRGTRVGVPRILDILNSHEAHASFFFCVGPDNMGRHVWRLVNPNFAWKMLRSNAPALYGWDILMAGSCWPGPSIARHGAAQIRATASAGHEIGLHGWDHYRWQVKADQMSIAELRHEIALGVDALGDILGQVPTCSAAPAWKCNDRVLAAKQSFDFTFNSDCRGNSIFVPIVDGSDATVQIPTTLPTFDESVGRHGLTPATYNDWILDRAEENEFNVLTVHAEVEGIVFADLFDAFLKSAAMRGFAFVPLGRLLSPGAPIERAWIAPERIPGRAGVVAMQQGFAPVSHREHA